jgi:hypothetical protein
LQREPAVREQRHGVQRFKSVMLMFGNAVEDPKPLTEMD